MAKEFKGRLISPYQHDGVAWMSNREKSPQYPGGFLCDEMGLGKTVQTIATMAITGGRTLIVCPRSVVPQWVAEIKRFAPEFRVITWDRKTPSIKEFDVVVTTYSMLVPFPASTQTTKLHRVNWDRVVLDEGHEIRNKTTKAHKSAVSLHAKIRWILSGTPVFNSMNDFVSLCMFLGADKKEVQRSFEWFRTNLVLRRTKDSVCQFNERLRLPPCEFQNIELQMYPEEATLYRNIYEEMQGKVSDILQSQPVQLQMMYILECMLRCRQLLIWPQMFFDGVAKKEERDPEEWTGRSKKLETLVGFIKEHPEEKTLVFCQFMGEMDKIHDLLLDEDMKVYRIDGGVNKDDREKYIHRFKTRAGGCVFLIQVKAGGVGLNLQEATRVYITSPCWNPATELQAIGRAHRTGQTQKVYVKKLIYTEESSIEESIVNLQGHKAIVCAEVLNDPKFAEQLPTGLSNKMGIKELRKLFSR
jgi:SNF2 family DNA or RNA helicase